MTLKKFRIIFIFLLFFLSFLWHYVYDLLPNLITSIFFPVNESIWEHMKIIYGVILIGTIIEIIIYNKYNIKNNNKYIAMMAKPLLGVIIYLVLYLPLFKLFQDNLIMSLSIMLLVYFIIQYIGFRIYEMDELNINILPIIIIILSYILFGILTYYPPRTFLFFDYLNIGYGIIK